MTTKKKVRLGLLEADVEQFALVINYTTEIQHVDNAGQVVGQESVPGQKVIRVPRGLGMHEVGGLAQEVIEKCKYIHASRVSDVEQILCDMMQYEAAQAQQQTPSRGQQQAAAQRQQTPTRAQQYQAPPPQQYQQASRQQGTERYQEEQKPQKPAKRQDPILPDADIRHLDDYQEQLYEENMDNKVIGAKKILRVCTEPKSLELLAEHDTLLGVLSRELKENSKRSAELSVAIVCTFLCFSHFSQFHNVLMQHQCGNVIMRVFEYESERHQVRKQDMDRRQMRFQDLGESATVEDKKLLQKDQKKHKIQINKQNKLLYVALMALLNLAEEISVERKMVNRKMPLLLTQVLDRSHEELLLVALQFMKKLSVFEENKEQMATPEVLTRLVQLASHENLRIALLSLRVLYNFSFDEKLRGELIESGIVKLLVDLLRNPPFRHIVLRLLYHFSMEDRCKSIMAYLRDGMIMLLQLVVHFPEARVGKDLVALLVNLSTHPRAAEVVVGSGLFPQILLRVLKTRDPLLCKVIRHVSAHPSVLEPMHELLQSESVRMSKWMHEFVRMAANCVDHPDLLLEVLGTLANVTLPDIPWGELCEAGLVDLLTRLLVPSFSEDDIVLECIMIVGNLALMRESAQYVAGSRVPTSLQQLLVEKREDEEIVIQLLHTFQCLLVYEEVREAVLMESKLAPCVMRFACGSSPAVLEAASRFLEVVAESMGEGSGAEWQEQLKAFRFEQHNAEWCRYIAREMGGNVCTSPGGGYGGYYDEQDGDYPDGGEEEFAYRHGLAADATDLAEREWGNKDMASFQHTGRHMAIS